MWYFLQFERSSCDIHAIFSITIASMINRYELDITLVYRVFSLHSYFVLLWWWCILIAIKILRNCIVKIGTQYLHFLMFRTVSWHFLRFYGSNWSYHVFLWSNCLSFNVILVFVTWNQLSKNLDNKKSFFIDVANGICVTIRLTIINFENK